MTPISKKHIIMKKHQIILAMAFLAVCLFLTSCRKDITVPNSEMNKLFGNWQWIETSGGFAGQVKTPATEGYSQSVEFKSDGIYKLYHDGKQKDKKTFTLSQGSSIHDTVTAVLITYKNTGCGNKTEDVIKQSVKFGGQDTLFLLDECADCYSFVFVRK
jgi:hypothetical protein